MLNEVKLALQVTATAYDPEITALIAAGLADLGIAGIDARQDEPLVRQAVKTYVRCHFGSPADYDRLKAAYDEQKAQLRSATGFTDWGDDDDVPC